MNKSIIVLLTAMTIFACKHSNKNIEIGNNKSIQTGNTTISLNEINTKVDSLLKINKFKEASILLDSLILINKTNSFLYFKRGSLKAKKLDFDSALSDFQKAENLGYSRAKCQKMILFCKSMKSGKNEF